MEVNNSSTESLIAEIEKAFLILDARRTLTNRVLNIEFLNWTLLEGIRVSDPLSTRYTATDILRPRYIEGTIAPTLGSSLGAPGAC